VINPPPLPPPPEPPPSEPPPVPQAAPEATPALQAIESVPPPPPGSDVPPLPAMGPDVPLPPIGPRFGVHWLALLGVVPLAAIRWVASGPLAEEKGLSADAAIGFRVGTILWGMLFACVPAWLAFRVTGRRRGVATAAFVAVYGLFTVGYMARAMLSIGPSRVAADTTAAGSPGRPTESVVSTPEAAPPREAFERATAALRAAQAKTTEPTQAWAASGAFNLSAIRSVQDLDRRLEVLEALGRANRAARMASEQVLTQLRGDLMAAGGGTAVQRELWLAQWAGEVKLDDDRQVLLAVEKFLGNGRVQLKMLRETWGRWYLDRSTDRVVFDDAALQERFARGARQVSSAEADLNEALRKAKTSAAQ
jgi:hypothetical protein